MNILAFAAAAILPILALVALNFDEMYGYYVYHLPVAGSAIDGYRISYTTMEEKDYRYSILPFHSSNRTPVYDYVELDSPVHEPSKVKCTPPGAREDAGLRVQLNNCHAAGELLLTFHS